MKDFTMPTLEGGVITGMVHEGSDEFSVETCHLGQGTQCWISKEEVQRLVQHLKEMIGDDQD